MDGNKRAAFLCIGLFLTMNEYSVRNLIKMQLYIRPLLVSQNHDGNLPIFEILLIAEVLVGA